MIRKHQKNHQGPVQQSLRRIALAVLAAEVLALGQPVFASSWSPTLLANTEAFQIIDDRDPTGNPKLQFGDTLKESLIYDRANLRFKFSRDLLVGGSLTATGALSIKRNMSGASLRVDGGADIWGTLRSSGAIRTKSSISGASLSIDGTTQFKGITYTWPTTAAAASGKVLKVDPATGQLVWSADATGAGGGISQAEGDARFVNVAGDSMTGALAVKKNAGTATGNILVIDSKGLIYDATNKRVGVNKLAPATALDVVGTVSGSSLTFMGANSYILGNVGIGKSTTPNTKLEVVGTISGSSLAVKGTTIFNGITYTWPTTAAAASGKVLKVDPATGQMVWSADSTGGGGISQTDGDARFVNTAGDTMTGSLRNNAAGIGLNVLNTMSGGALTVSSLRNCDTIDTNASGVLACGTDAGGAGGGISQSEADARFVQKQGSTMTGTLVVNATTANLVKTSSGRILATDFSLAGTVFNNVTSTNDLLTLDDGVVPASGAGIMVNTGATMQAAVGAGGQTILRDDGKYIIIHGNGTAVGSIWDGFTLGAMSASPTAPSTANIGAGAIALKRPDGRYLVINGGGSLGTTALFDPRGITATTVTGAPAVCGGLATGAGTNAFLRNDGKYVIICGGQVKWGVYDPTASTYTAGTDVGTAFGAGAHAIMRDNGTFLVFRGGNTTSHWLYNPLTSAAGTMTADPITANPPTITTGAFSLRRKDGKFLVLRGTIGTSSGSYIYNPAETSANGGAGSMTSQSGVGFGPTAALADGAQAIWRQDGKMLLIIGAGSTATNIIDPSQSGNTQFTAGPTLAGAIGAGIHMFMRPDGRYQLIRGGATTTTDIYNMGFVIGNTTGSGTQLARYQTECMTTTSLNPSSRFFWNANQEGYVTFQVRTGNGGCTGAYKSILNNGDVIRSTAGDNRVQVKVNFKRQFPNFADQEWKLRRGLGQTLYRRVSADPAVYDFTIDNSSMVHRTQFEFGNSADPSGPIAINIVNDKDKQMSIALAAGVGYGSTLNATNPQIYNGAFGTHTVLTTTATAGTIVMRRPDGKFVVISGNTTTANAQVYDPVAQTFTALGATPAVGTGLGARAFKRPDGKFFIVIGNNTTTTSIFDPIANTFTAGPVLTAAAGRGGLVIPLPTGRVLILHGNFLTTSSMYDPYQNTMVAGPVTSAVVGGGAMAIPRPDGTYFVVLGIATEACTALNTVTNSFNPYTMIFTSAGSPAITTGVGPGAFAFQRSDGQWVIVHGGGTVTTCAAAQRSQIYNPITNQSVVGPLLSGAAAANWPQHGAHAIPRPDGTWLIVHGNGSTNTSIYLEKTGAFTAGGLSGIGQFIAGPPLVTAASAGSISFQRDDGKFVTINGNAGTVTHQYDAGWVDRGMYKSEQLNLTDLDSASTLSWRGFPDLSGISAEVRTATSQLGLQTVVSRDVAYPGARINPGAGETWIRVHFNFMRTFPSYTGIFTDTWYNGGSPNLFTQRVVPTPTLTEFKINKDKDLINLKSDSRGIFRVNSNGDIYTSAQSAILTGGADIAERYTSVEMLVPGDVVAVDRSSGNGVIRSVAQYQTDVVGVVSTNPGLVAGAYTENSYPIALMGRVKVKVSTENGPIVAGDRLAASRIPGHAMKAKRKSRVIGMALENANVDEFTTCPEATAVPVGTKCGTMMLFVNLSDWPGPIR